MQQTLILQSTNERSDSSCHHNATVCGLLLVKADGKSSCQAVRSLLQTVKMYSLHLQLKSVMFLTD